MLQRVIREVKHNQSSCSTVELSQSRSLSEGLALQIVIDCKPASLLVGLLSLVVGGHNLLWRLLLLFLRAKSKIDLGEAQLRDPWQLRGNLR